MERKKIVGLSMKGGKRDNFTFCLLEFFPGEKRWFLRSVLQVKDEEDVHSDEAMRTWIDDFELDKLVVDFPLNLPNCHSCALDCPGASKCPVHPIVEVRRLSEKLLREDQAKYRAHPKTYELERNSRDEVDFKRDILAKEPQHHLLSRSFKRRLKKPFLPYWNRTLDFWVWSYYYDQLLDLFNTSFDSFGNSSLMLQLRFSYLKRHFPNSLELFESNTQLILIELLRSKIIAKKDILEMTSIEVGAEARLDIIKKIEDKLDIFIYDNDLELLIRNPRAFDSFLLAVAGRNLHTQSLRPMPEWTMPEETKFIVPIF